MNDYQLIPAKASGWQIGVVRLFLILFLSYIVIFSANFFLSLYLEGLTYILLEVAGFGVVLTLVLNSGINVLVPPKVVVSLLLLLSSGLISSFLAPKPVYHYFYFFSFFIKVLLLFLVVGSRFKLPREGLLRFSIRFALLCSLFWSVLHLKFGSGRPGWLWPINISIQEITLLLLFCSLLMLSRVSKELWVLAAFTVLLTFRSSGKTALILLWSIPVLFYFMKRFSFVRGLVKRFCFLYFFTFMILVCALCVLYGDEVVFHYSSYRDTVVGDRVPFWKRLSLIVEGLYHLSSSASNLIFGTGYGYPNYLSQVDSYLKNTPQLFVLTLMVYGGVFFAFSYYYFLHSFVFYLLYRIKLDLYGQCLCYIAVFIMVAFFTTHEYFNNPFVFAALVVFIVSAKVRAKSLSSSV